MIKLRSLLHVRGLSGHPTMRECLGPSPPANKLHFAGKYFSLVSGFLCFLQSEWKIDPISRNGDNTNLSVSYIITISMGIVNTLTQSRHEKQNWKLTNNIFYLTLNLRTQTFRGLMGICEDHRSKCWFTFIILYLTRKFAQRVLVNNELRAEFWSLG